LLTSSHFIRVQFPHGQGSYSSDWQCCGSAYRHIRDLLSQVLSPRQQQIVRLVAAGFEDKEIAAQLGISEGSVVIN